MSPEQGVNLVTGQHRAEMARPTGLLETASWLFQPFGLRGFAARIKTLARFVEQGPLPWAEHTSKQKRAHKGPIFRLLARPTGFEPVTPAFGELNLSNVLIGFDPAGSVSC